MSIPVDVAPDLFRGQELISFSFQSLDFNFVMLDDLLEVLILDTVVFEIAFMVVILRYPNRR